METDSHWSAATRHSSLWPQRSDSLRCSLIPLNRCADSSPVECSVSSLARITDAVSPGPRDEPSRRTHLYALISCLLSNHSPITEGSHTPLFFTSKRLLLPGHLGRLLSDSWVVLAKMEILPNPGDRTQGARCPPRRDARMIQRRSTDPPGSGSRLGGPVTSCRWQRGVHVARSKLGART